MSETPWSDPLHDVAEDLRRVGFHIDAGELALHLNPPGPGVPVSIAGQEYLARPRADGQPGLRLVHRLAVKPEREHR